VTLRESSRAHVPTTELLALLAAEQPLGESRTLHLITSRFNTAPNVLTVFAPCTPGFLGNPTVLLTHSTTAFSATIPSAMSYTFCHFSVPSVKHRNCFYAALRLLRFIFITRRIFFAVTTTNKCAFFTITATIHPSSSTATLSSL